MTDQTRYSLLAILGLTLIAAMILTMGLGRLEFKPGQPFVTGGSDAPSVEANGGPKTPAGGQILPFVQGAAAFLFIVLLFYLAINLISAVGFKRILKSAAALAVSLAILAILPRINTPELTPIEAEEPIRATQQAFEYPLTPLGEPPRSLVWLVIILIAAAVIVLVGWLILRRKRQPDSIETLLEQAENAVNALQNGESARSVIVRYYIQMSQVLQEERGIERGAAVTPHEFVELLAAKGLPAEPLRQLTRLFETVRYGNQPVSVQDERSALESLTTIVTACRTGAQPL